MFGPIIEDRSNESGLGYGAFISDEESSISSQEPPNIPASPQSDNSSLPEVGSLPSERTPKNTAAPDLLPN